MNLSELLKIMDQFFVDKVESDSISGRVTIGDKVKTYLSAFINPIDEDKNPILDLTGDYLRKIFNGSEKLSIPNASFLSSNLDLRTFEDFCADLTEDSVNQLINLFSKHNHHLDFENFEADILKVFSDILYLIRNASPKQSIRKAVFVGPNKVKIGNKVLNLPSELTPQENILESEQPYVNALLRVYSQDAKFGDITLEELNSMDPKYINHFKIQREHYFSAESILHQIRDVFPDGILEFDALKKETLSGVSSVILKAYKNALERVNSTMEHVVLISYGKSYLATQTSGFIGISEKQGIVHMLVNDGKIEWVVDYDKDI